MVKRQKKGVSRLTPLLLNSLYVLFTTWGVVIATSWATYGSSTRITRALATRLTVRVETVVTSGLATRLTVIIFWLTVFVVAVVYWSTAVVITLRAMLAVALVCWRRWRTWSAKIGTCGRHIDRYVYVLRLCICHCARVVCHCTAECYD